MIFIVVAVVGMLVAASGFAGRGTWSTNIATIGGIVWLVGIALCFWHFRWFIAAGVLLLTFVVGNLGERILRRLMGTTNRPTSWEMMRANERAHAEREDLLRLIDQRRRESRINKADRENPAG